MNTQKNFSSVGHLVGPSASKERETAPTPIEIQETTEYKPSDEVKEFIKSRQAKVKLDTELKKAGVRERITLPKQRYYKTVHLPISDELVVRGLHASVMSSFRWLAEWAAYLLKKAHIILKTVHGHVVRRLQK